MYEFFAINVVFVEKAAAQQAEAARIQSLKFSRKPTVAQQQPSSAHHVSLATTSSDVGIRDTLPAVSTNSQQRAEPVLNNMGKKLNSSFELAFGIF